MNRGLARRTLFETEEDVRYFLSRVARAVRQGLIEVPAYSVLTTHFHLLVSSPRAELPEAMRRIQNGFVRHFNRRRKRDGPLFRGRYRSRPVETWTYRQVLVRYIDDNAVAAGLVGEARLYPHGSARWYAQEKGPPWLSRNWVESLVKPACLIEAYCPGEYRRVFGGRLSDAQRRLVDRRMEQVTSERDPLDELLKAAPSEVLAWMRRKAALADGTGVGLALADPSALDSVGGLSSQVQVALLRDLCGLTFSEIALHAGVTGSAAWKLYAKHRRSSVLSESYAHHVAGLVGRILERTESGTFASTARKASEDRRPSRAVETNVPDSVRSDPG